MRALGAELAVEGVTVFLSSRLLTEIEQLCSHVGVMSRGRLVWQGPLAGLQSEQSARVRVETADVAGAASVLARLGLADVRPEPGGDAVGARLGDRPPERVVDALVRAGVGVRGFAVERPSLEDRFVELTGEGFDVSG